MSAPDRPICLYCESDDVEAVCENHTHWQMVCGCCGKTFSLPKPQSVRDEEREERIRG